MDAYKLRVYVSGHNFEAEGDKDTVERQFQAFTEMVNRTLALAGSPSLGAISPEYGLSKIARVDDKIVFLTTLPQTNNPEGDALLVILLAQKVMLGREWVSGADLLTGINRSGVTVQRIDRALGGTWAALRRLWQRRG